MTLELAEQTAAPLSANFFQKLVKGIKKIGLAAPRNAYLGMVALNVHGWASKLATAVSRDDKRLRSKWEKIGGDYNQLKKAIASGAKKQHLFDGERNQEVILSEDGTTATPLSVGGVAAALALAAPIIAALAPILKSILPEKAGEIDATVEEVKKLSPDTALDPTDPGNAAKFDTQKSFFDSIPTPVKYAGGAFLLLLTYKALNKK